jgi:putative solute:sodium symporter small subunit
MPLPPKKNVQDGAYWRAVIRLILGLLAVWAFVSLGAAILLVRQFDLLRIGNLPGGFWMAQQGSIVVFVALIWIYAKRMDRIDRVHKHADDTERESNGGNQP